MFPTKFNSKVFLSLNIISFSGWSFFSGSYNAVSSFIHCAAKTSGSSTVFDRLSDDVLCYRFSLKINEEKAFLLSVRNILGIRQNEYSTKNHGIEFYREYSIIIITNLSRVVVESSLRHVLNLMVFVQITVSST